MLITKNTEMMIIKGMLIGICISGFALLCFEFFALCAMRSIRIPVVPPDITPPIPRMEVKFAMWKYSTNM